MTRGTRPNGSRLRAPFRVGLREALVIAVLLVLGLLATVRVAGSGERGPVSLHDLDPGTRVRIDAPSLRMEGARGHFLRRDGDVLVLGMERNRGPWMSSPDREVQVPVDAVLRMEAVRGREVTSASAAGIGALIGLGTGVVVGYAEGDDPPGWLSFSREGKAVFLGIGLGLVGLLTGAVMGAIVGPDWEPVRLHPGHPPPGTPAGAADLRVMLRF